MYNAFTSTFDRQAARRLVPAHNLLAEQYVLWLEENSSCLPWLLQLCTALQALSCKRYSTGSDAEKRVLLAGRV